MARQQRGSVSQYFEEPCFLARPCGRHETDKHGQRGDECYGHRENAEHFFFQVL